MTIMPIQQAGGIYLKCVVCGNTIDGVEVTQGFGDAVPPLHRGQGAELYAEAAKRGWSHRGRGLDYCPDHTPNRTTQSHE